jgi:beta-carotene hydroxylase
MPRPPSLSELGTDLLYISGLQRLMTLLLPLVCVVAYASFAIHRVWPLAVISLIYLSFITYGSISHDLVHRTLGLPLFFNELFLTVIELLAFRSGHAYRRAHLHHHARFPNEDDIEGAAARMSFGRAVLEGFVFQPRIILWAQRRSKRDRAVVVFETLVLLWMLALCFLSIPITPLPAIYATLMIMGSWIIPLVTSYLPHRPQGEDMLRQTVLFRGKVLSIIAMEHLYHLEHHLYPMVPHHNWPKLATRLDPYFKNSGIQPVILKF